MSYDTNDKMEQSGPVGFVDYFCQKFPHPFLVVSAESHDVLFGTPGGALGEPDHQTTKKIVEVYCNNDLPESWEEVAVFPVNKNSNKHPFPFITVGRANNNDVILPVKEVSTIHLILQEDRRGMWTIEDTGSTNGTYLNGEKLATGRQYTIRNGDHMVLAGVLAITFYSASGLYDFLNLTNSSEGSEHQDISDN